MSYFPTHYLLRLYEEGQFKKKKKTFLAKDSFFIVFLGKNKLETVTSHYWDEQEGKGVKAAA